MHKNAQKRAQSVPKFPTGKSAVPKGTAAVPPPRKTAPVPIPVVVQNPPPSGQVVQGVVTGGSAMVVSVGNARTVKADAFRWNGKKRDALKMQLSGHTIVAIAEKLNVHRNTITNWMKDPAWMAEAQRTLREGQMTSKLKRLKSTSVLADKLAVAADEMLENDRFIKHPGAASLVLQQHSSYVKAERELYGESDGAPGSSAPIININVGGQGGAVPVSEGKEGTSMLAFTEFLHKYDPNVEVLARSPQEAVMLGLEKVLQESTLLDTVRAEDKEMVRQEVEAEESAKRRR